MQAEGGSFFTEVGPIDINDVASVGLQGFDEAKAAINTLENVPQPTEGNISGESTTDEQLAEKKLAESPTTETSNSAPKTSDDQDFAFDASPTDPEPMSDLLANTGSETSKPTIKSPIDIPVNVEQL